MHVFLVIHRSLTLGGRGRTKLTCKCQSLSIVFVGAFDIILPGMYRD